MTIAGFHKYPQPPAKRLLTSVRTKPVMNGTDLSAQNQTNANQSQYTMQKALYQHQPHSVTLCSHSKEIPALCHYHNEPAHNAHAKLETQY